MKPYIAELIGTCLFALVLILSSGSGAWVVTIFVVFTLILLSYTIGHISGAHVNPAITIGATMVKKIAPMRALYYVIAQLAGAALAVLFVKWIGAAIPPIVKSPIDWKLFSAELVGTMIFGFGVASVMFKRVEKGPAGFVVGLSLFTGIIVSSLMLAGSSQGAVLNPALAFGLNLVTVESLIAPLIGSIIGMWIFVLISEDARATWNGIAAWFAKKGKNSGNSNGGSDNQPNHENKANLIAKQDSVNSGSGHNANEMSAQQQNNQHQNSNPHHSQTHQNMSHSHNN